jgi:hypothetical protein
MSKYVFQLTQEPSTDEIRIRFMIDVCGKVIGNACAYGPEIISVEFEMINSLIYFRIK